MMNGIREGIGQESTSVSRGWNSAPTRERLFQEIERMWPGLPADSGTFRAAAIVVAARWVGQNVDKLSRFCGFEREFVARCTRRLCDNGLWIGGIAVLCDVEEPGVAALQLEVDVAEGKLCRRVDETGEHWEPHGQWRKTLEEALAEAAEAAMLASEYADDQIDPVLEAWLDGDDEEDARDRVLTLAGAGVTGGLPAGGEIRSTWEAPRPAAPATVIADLFPGAHWLG